MNGCGTSRRESGDAMNIVLYVNCFLPVIGGREIVVHHLAGALKELGHRVRVVGPAGLWSQRRLRFDYPLHRFPTLLGGAFADQEGLCKLLIDSTLWGCDVLHAHNTFPCGYAAARLKSIRNLPLVITPHGEDIHVIPEIGYGQRLDPVKRRKIGYALQKAELVTAVSDSIEASLLDAGAPQAKIRKVPNGIDSERFQRPAGADIRRRLGLEGDARLIVTVGNYRPCKGHEVLIRSMPLILSREPRARLVIVGKTADPLKSLAEQLGLRSKVAFTGVVAFPIPSNGATATGSSEPDWLAGIYQESEVYVSAGIGEGAEGMSLAMLEAMAAGLPIVATDISGNRDMVRHERTGFVVPPSNPDSLAEGVLRLLHSDELRVRMGGESRRASDGYRWTGIARRYLSVYREARERCDARTAR